MGDTQPDKKYEAFVKEFGNGAHVVLPKEYLGQVVRIEPVCQATPPLFDGVEEGKSVFIGTGNGKTVNGEVIEYESNVGKQSMSATVVIATETTFYRVTTEREVGEDGWGEYTFETASKGHQDSGGDGEREALENINQWEPVGEIDSFAVGLSPESDG